jgi:hypothetical protein
MAPSASTPRDGARAVEDRFIAAHSALIDGDAVPCGRMRALRWWRRTEADRQRLRFEAQPERVH